MCIFPTDLNLLWDAGRKCVDLIEKYRDQFGYALPLAQGQGLAAATQAVRNVSTSQIVYRGGPNKEARVQRAVRDYLGVGRGLSARCTTACSACVTSPWTRRIGKGWPTSHRMLDKHLDLVQRRLLNQETIPGHEKVFSLFEPHTEWIQKGKATPQCRTGPSAAGRDRPAPVGPRL